MYDKGNLISLLAPYSDGAEQLKQLCSHLDKVLPPRHHKGKEQPRLIMVCSSQSGEGKSFVAANLATTLALHTSKPVLLIDADLRNPTCHAFFGHQNEQGLSEYLRREKRLDHLLVQPRVGGLKLLPAGQGQYDSFKLLSSKRMAKLLTEIRNKCPQLQVIIDSAPADQVAEAKVLAKQMDGVLLVSNQQQSGHAALERQVATFGQEKLLGVVINHFTAPVSPFAGKAKGSYYGKAA